MNQKFIKKLFVWIGIFSVASITIGLPLFFIGGSGQKVSDSNIKTKDYSKDYGEGEAKETFKMKFNPDANQPGSFLGENGKPVQAHIEAGNADIIARVAKINIDYQTVKNSVKTTGFFEVKKLSDDVNNAVKKIGDQLIWIRDNNVWSSGDTPGEGKNKNYSLSASLFDIQQQLKLIVRVDSGGDSINNVLNKNIEDNAALAISGIVFSSFGLIGLLGSIIGYNLYKKNNS